MRAAGDMGAWRVSIGLLVLLTGCHAVIDADRHVCVEGCDGGGDGALDSAPLDSALDGRAPDAAADALPDGEPPDAPPAMCSVASQCDDLVFCNGAERCDPGDPSADASGCAPGVAPGCDDTIACSIDSCDATLDACVHLAPDLDEDGSGDANCLDSGGASLGDDCDDGDPMRYPEASESCNGLDDDCDTLIDEDASIASCGAVAQGEASCSMGCVVGSCEIPFLDCNGEYEDGCETDTDSSVVHCGSCETICTDASCHSGACGLAVQGVAGATSIACIIRPDGAVWCWGVAMGATPDEFVDIPEAAGATHIDSELNQLCAALDDGTVRCWGRAAASGTPSYFPDVPMQPDGLTDATHVQVGYRNACALRSTGGVACWGTGEGSVLGPGITGAEERTTAVVIGGITGAVQLAGSWRNMCARDMGGIVRCWGTMADGLGDSAGTTTSATPVIVVAPAAMDVAVSRNHGCVVTTTGQVHCWGRNTERQLGDGTNISRSSPVRAHDIVDAEVVRLQDNITCVRRTGGTFSCWGTNNGRFADGTWDNSATPISGITAEPVLGLDITLSAGFAITAAGQLLSWGGDDWYRRRAADNLRGLYATGTID